ncbi:hypothetical protein GHJ49_03785 [Alistipes sp. dk3620]|mgnify:CR=1 FL=1|uniref:hypothetical protein n=1 Tax=unclassified Alistipes TaxID=2608932 RepID=UPI001295B568|nr:MULTISPECIES: hypothetical protein [unclassified Alistipes]MQX26770.1 hypothetical protein [Alistipes sp. dk3620]QGA24163.1 hypothetical protein GFH31_10155 [Alistipes sp. dk3624]
MRKILLFVMAAALFCGCEKDEPRIDPSAFFASLKHADIADAQSLYVASGVATRGGDEAADVQTLYKITFNGETQKVEFVNENGKPTDVKTNYVMNLSDKFLLINVSVATGTPYDVDYAFVVRKSDGAIFAPGLLAGADYPMPPMMGFFQKPYNGDVVGEVEEKAWKLQTDTNNDVYFPSGGIAKIYDDAIGNVFVEELVSFEMLSNIQTNGYIYDMYTVNGNGDVWILGEFSNTSLCRLNSGTFVRGVDYKGEFSARDVFTLPGHPNNYYRLEVWDRNWSLYKYTAQQNALTEETVIVGSYESLALTPSNGRYNVVRLDECAVVFAGRGVFVVNGETDVRFYNVKFPERLEDRPHLHSDKYLYTSDNQGNILRFDPTTGTVSPIYSNTHYEIRNLRLFADDLMQFSAFDLRTGKTVIVEVDNGQERIIDMIDGRTVIQMERIN